MTKGHLQKNLFWLSIPEGGSTVVGEAGSGNRKLAGHIFNCTQKVERELQVNKAVNTQSSHPAVFFLQQGCASSTSHNLPKQLHQMGTESPNTCAHGGHHSIVVWLAVVGFQNFKYICLSSPSWVLKFTGIICYYSDGSTFVCYKLGISVSVHFVCLFFRSVFYCD